MTWHYTIGTACLTSASLRAHAVPGWRIAASRWDSILLARPDLAPAVDLQRKLIGLVIDLTGALEQGRLPRLSLPSRYLAAKLKKGIPALAGEPIPMPTAVLKPVLLQLCAGIGARRRRRTRPTISMM